jgi:RNA polymerase sigma-70 factor (ECF subfamily)
MAALSEEQRMVMTLVVLDGRSYRETAEFLDIPIGSVMSRLARARAAVDAQLRGQLRGIPEQGAGG